MSKAIDETLPIIERRALGWCALGAVVAILWITLPVGVGILLGTLVAFSLQPLYERIRERTGRAGTAALITEVLAGVMTFGSIAGLVFLFVMRGAALVHELVDVLSPGGSANRVTDKLAPLLDRLGMTPDELVAKLRDAATEIASRAAAIAEGILAETASMLLALFFAMMTLNLMLRNWRAISQRAQEVLPLRPDYTRDLFDEFRRVGRTTLLGTVVTGIAQGVFATIGFLLAGVPEPVFFGAATAVASLIPAVGTLLVWVPAGIILILAGRVTAGIVDLAWGAAVIVGVSDYVIRPRLVGGKESTPTMVTFAALFGGVEVFSLKGLILGPVIMSLAIAVLRLYAREAASRRSAYDRGLSPEEAARVSPSAPP